MNKPLEVLNKLITDLNRQKDEIFYKPDVDSGEINPTECFCVYCKKYRLILAAESQIINLLPKYQS